MVEFPDDTGSGGSGGDSFGDDPSGGAGGPSGSGGPNGSGGDEGLEPIGPGDVGGPVGPDGSTPSADESGQFTQQVRHQQVSARVPESVAPGVFSSGTLVMTGPQEFIIDFLQTVTRPHQVAARVILPVNILPSVLRAFAQNLETFKQRFGPPPELPKPAPGQKPPSAEEVYQNLKLQDNTAAGTYANMVMITHSPSDFCFDFITSFYPRSTVAARIYMSATQAPRLYETLNRSWMQFQQKVEEARKKQQGEGGDETRYC